MKNGTHVFIFTILMFALGTSAIGYSFAKESYDNARVQAAFTLIGETPWYCVPQNTKVKAQGLGDTGYGDAGYYKTAPGYAPSGYMPTGYYIPGYTSPGYIPPPKTPSGYVSSGYNSPGYMPAGYEDGAPQNPLYNPNWQTKFACPNYYKVDTTLIMNKCATVLKNKLNGAALPADSAKQYYDCQGMYKSQVWNLKISQKVCGAFTAYSDSCKQALQKRKACVPLAKYLTDVGVAAKDLTQTQTDAIYFCKSVFP